MEMTTVIRGCYASRVNLYTSMASQITCLEHVPLKRAPIYYMQQALIAAKELVESNPAVDGRLEMNMFHLSCGVVWTQP